MAEVIGVTLQADDQISPKVKNIKAELKAAQAEVVTLTEKFGATSKQAAEAAKKAAELKDKIGDAAQLVDAFNPDTKFKAFGASIQTVVGGFTALTGVMGLLGVESEQVQKTLLKVQSALAISQGIAQLQEGIQSFKNLGSVMMQTLGKSGMIGIALAGVALLGAALLGLFDGPSQKVKELNNSLKDLAKGQAEATKQVYETKNAFKQAELGIISKKDALDIYNNGIGKTIGFAKDLNEAERLTAVNAAKYIEVQGLKAQANYLLAKSSEISAKALISETQLAQAKFDSRTFQGGLIDQFKNDVEIQKKDAAELMSLIDGINAKIAIASKGFVTTDPPGTGKATTRAGKEKEKEIAELSYLDKLLIQYEEEQAAIRNQLHDLELEKRLSVNDSINVSNESSTLLFLQNKARENQATAQQLAIEEYAANSRIRLTGTIGQALGALADLVGKQTAAGKVLAIAEATINTYLAASSILKNTARNPVTGAIPGFAVFQMIATIAAGLVTVRNIIKTPVPGGGGGGAPSNISVSAPLAPQRTNTTTSLDRDSLNAIGAATTRAFVLDADIVNNRERSTRLNRAARL